VDGTEVTFDAFFWVYLELQDIPSGDETQESTQWTEISAPVSFPLDVEKNETDEQNPDEESLSERSVDC